MDFQFADTEETPSGRHRVVPSPDLLHALHDSAQRGKSKVVTLSPGEVKELRRQLATSIVKERWRVTTKARTDENGNSRFIFRAHVKPKQEAELA